MDATKREILFSPTEPRLSAAPPGEPATDDTSSTEPVSLETVVPYPERSVYGESTWNRLN
jgi:hypothetical protein